MAVCEEDDQVWIWDLAIGARITIIRNKIIEYISVCLLGALGFVDHQHAPL